MDNVSTDVLVYDDRIEYIANALTFVVFNDKLKMWYFNGKLHRENGPAVDDGNGTKHWYFKGKLHREDGPAIEFANGTRQWYSHGVRLRVSCENFML